MEATYIETQQISFQDFKNQILEDYKLGRISREMSYLGRREVLTGKAKFGIFGDGKELPQLAMAKVFRSSQTAQNLSRYTPKFTHKRDTKIQTNWRHHLLQIRRHSKNA